jgi:hypothetical protein
MMLVLLAWILFLLYWHFCPEIKYIRSEDMYIMWYNAGKDKRKYLIVWRNFSGR